MDTVNPIRRAGWFLPLLFLLGSCTAVDATQIVANTSRKASEKGSAKVTMTMTARSTDKKVPTFSSTSDGVFDFARRRGSMTTRTTLPEMPPVLPDNAVPEPSEGEIVGTPGEPAFTPATSMTVVTDGEITFVSCPVMRTPRRWIQLEAPNFDDGSLSPFMLDPGEMLDGMKRIASTVQQVGHDRIRGTRTTHYRFKIDASSEVDDVASSDRPEMQDMQPDRVDAWIDDEGFPRKVVLNQGSPAGGFEMAMEIYDYGVPVKISLPNDVDIVGALDASEWISPRATEVFEKCFGGPGQLGPVTITPEELRRTP